MWSDYDYDRDEREDREYAFEVTCGSCGELYLNTSSVDCPTCGSASQSYASADASRWNSHMRRTGR